MTVKLVAIDMDQTLLRADKTYDEVRFAKVLEQLLAKDVTVCIASGNSYHKLTDFFSPEVRHELYFAGDNGNYICYQQQVMRTVGIDKPTFLAIVDFFDKIDGFYVSASTGELTYLRENSGPAYEKVLRYNNEVQIIDDFAQLPDDVLMVKLAIYSRHSLAKNKVVVQQVSEKFDDIAIVTSGDEWVDVYHIKGGKGEAIAYLQEKLGVTPEQSMAFGDSLNDETMMKQVKYSIAMANADVDLALHCAYKIGNNEDQAVIDVLEQLVVSDTMAFMEEYKTKR